MWEAAVENQYMMSAGKKQKERLETHLELLETHDRLSNPGVLASVFSSYVHPLGKRNYEIAVFIKKMTVLNVPWKKTLTPQKKKKKAR